MSVRGREAHPKIQEGSGGPPKGPGVVGRPTQRSRSPSQRSKRGQETLPERGREGHPKALAGLGGPPRGPKALLEIREWSGRLIKGPGGTSESTGGAGSPPGGPEGVGRPSQW